MESAESVRSDAEIKGVQAPGLQDHLEDPRDALRTGEPVEAQEAELEGATQGKRYVRIGGTRCLAKPRSGDQGDPLMPNREAAASALATAAGWEDMIAPTVIRNIDLGNGPEDCSVQATWQRDSNPNVIADYSIGDRERAAIFDIVLNNSDRRFLHNHVTTHLNGQPRLKLVDNGHGFGKSSGPSEFVSHLEGHLLSEEGKAGIRAMIEFALPEVADLMGQDQADRVRRRAEELLAAGCIKAEFAKE